MRHATHGVTVALVFLVCCQPLSAQTRWQADPALSGTGKLAQEFLTEVSAESAAAREQRHQLVAVRRRGPILLVRHGATAFAAENSLEAYAAVMDYGADGCEVDIRRTADGVLVLFQDDTLDRVTEGFGSVDQIDFRELENLPPHRAFGKARASVPPTFAALLDLARQRIMLLHLDLKEPGLEDEVAHFLAEADAWDHVVAVTALNATRLRQNPHLRLLRYQAPALYEGRRDVDPEAVAAALRQPVQMILVDDPRVGATVLQRDRYLPLPFTKTYRLTARPPTRTRRPDTNAFSPMEYVHHVASRLPAESTEALLGLLRGGERKGVSASWPDEPDQRAAQEILQRAWAAQRLGNLGDHSRRVIDRLADVVQRPGLHPDPRYCALDAAMAARALGRLRSTASVPVLITTIESAELGSAEGSDAMNEASRLAGGRRLKRNALEALGELPCRRAKRFLQQYVLAETAGRARTGRPLYEEATNALLRQRLAWDEIAALLRSTNREVRGTAILECWDEPTEERGQALRAAAPWAAAWSRPK